MQPFVLPVLDFDVGQIDQFLLRFVFGDDTELTAPVVTMSEDVKTIRVEATEL